ncbi:EAL domain-containing protein [Photobacterium galatheae]|uniref:EAL domain-containing protein n=1 Tax=Photobacterium galatheae TaxID=1654360 RepID=A0A066RMI6_9GAMM|nr:EAL domain-containing protein [Photobacterium galatheae]KDM91559.1 hypothetical protein EA58_11075 [Photobacterium galatheae]MCM0149632.1 EAL domain-containing protein [Photobacterium galatheae]
MLLYLYEKWKLSVAIFLIAIPIIFLLSNPLNKAIFTAEVNTRLENLQDAYLDKYQSIGTDIFNLYSLLEFNCEDHDLNLIRHTVEHSHAIQLIEFRTPSGVCSNYGKNVSIIQQQPSQHAIDTTEKNTIYSLENYSGHRVKITLQKRDVILNIVTVPFQHIFTESEAGIGCIGLSLEKDGQYLPLWPQKSNKKYLHISQKNFYKDFSLHVYANREGLQRITQPTTSMGQLLLLSGIFCLCIVIGLMRKETGMTSLIAQGLKKKEFLPFYQPIYNQRTQKIESCEVLLRWRRPNGEMISPALFIPMAEHNGQIVALTTFLLHKVASQLRSISPLPPCFYVSINVTPMQLQDETFPEHVFSIIDSYDLERRNFAFEVTERTPFTDWVSAEKVITRFQMEGILIKLDDAGTGYGGFSYLQKLPIRTLKIDKMFVDTIGTGDIKSNILDSIILFATNANLHLIAEGVETQEQADYLTQRGVTLMQGYHFAKPMPFSRLKSVMTEHGLLASVSDSSYATFT